ncbi:unnamed protein product [Lymnaea stagnalis]|uniref:Uncharacterized protein n=1 Tax=Lymnaea stagnalis TaxID=6523 RepID=A0AAV2HFW5_LYMST
MEVSEYQLRKREHLHMKKSESRNSHKTTKSCPATLGAVTTREITSSHGVTGSLEDVYSSRNLEFPFGRGFSHRSRSKVFAHMSLEARHAIDETLREMKAEEEQQQMNDGMGQTLLLPTDNEADHPDKDIETNEQLTGTSQHGLNKTTPGNYNNDDNLAENNFRKTLNATYPADNVRTRTDYLSGRMSTNRKLPQLDFGAVSPSGFPNPHQRLPDIGRPYEPVHYEPVHYEPVHFRENTFEITPVDFDIRFHQIIPCSPGDSPPPDIRQQSIEKCQQWLVRHTPRH